MKPFYWMTFYAIFGGLATISGIFTILRSPGYEIFGVFGILAGAYGFFQAWRLGGEMDKRKKK